MIIGLGTSTHPFVDLVFGWWEGDRARLSRRVGAGSTGRMVPWVVGTGGCWSGWLQGEDGGEGVVEVVGPGPGFGDFEASASLAADEACGGVQESVAQVLGSALARSPVRASSRSQASRSRQIPWCTRPG